MASIYRVNLLFNVLVSIFVISSSLKCSKKTFSPQRTFDSCTDLPYLESHLHWNYIPALKKVSIAYRSKQNSHGWIAWGINPTGIGMVGTQALVAFRYYNGSMTVYPTSITSYNPSMLPSPISFRVSNISAEYKKNEMIIYAVVGPLENGPVVNHVWQAGHSISSGIPQIHSTTTSHLQSMGRIDFSTKLASYKGYN